MSSKRSAIAVSAVVASILIGLSVQRGLRAEASEPKAPAANQASHKAAGTRLEQLPCFGCHNIEHYRKGKPKPVVPAKEDGDEPSKEFSHTLHQQEGVGHCHMCHAFEGHFRVVIRKETCAGCH